VQTISFHSLLPVFQPGVTYNLYLYINCNHGTASTMSLQVQHTNDNPPLPVFLLPILSSRYYVTQSNSVSLLNIWLKELKLIMFYDFIDVLWFCTTLHITHYKTYKRNCICTTCCTPGWLVCWDLTAFLTQTRMPPVEVALIPVTTPSTRTPVPLSICCWLADHAHCHPSPASPSVSPASQPRLCYCAILV